MQFNPWLTTLLGLAVAASPLAASTAAAAGTVTLSASLTSFQSALSPYTADGDGTVNGMALTVDAGLPTVQYGDGDPAHYPQSAVVSLAPGTTEVQFEYTSGIGPSANPNRIGFTAAGPAFVGVGDVFKVGTLSFTNGFWYPYATVGLTIQTASADATLDGKTFTGQVVFRVSNPVPFFPDPEANADFVYLADASGALSGLGSVRVYEKSFQPAGSPGNSGTVDLYARIGSLIPVQFANPSPGAFLSSSIDPVTSVPEPASGVLLAIGVAGLALRHMRRR